MNKEIEDTVSKSSISLQHKNQTQKEAMISQPKRNLPWSKVGSDLFEYKGKHHLVMVDYYSGFFEWTPAVKCFLCSECTDHPMYKMPDVCHLTLPKIPYIMERHHCPSTQHSLYFCQHWGNYKESSIFIN